VLHVQFQARNPSCQFRMRLWNFDVIPTSTTYLEVLEMSTVCVQLWLKNSNFPLLATSRGRSAASKIQNKNCTQNRKNPRNCYYIFSPVGLVIFVISSVDLGYKKTGCRRRNVLKEDLGAEDKIRKLVSSLWARLPGYGQKRPRYQWVPGYPMVWDMECLV